MYQLWRIIKRVPYMMNSTALSGIIIMYFVFGGVKFHTDRILMGYVGTYYNI